MRDTVHGANAMIDLIDESILIESSNGLISAWNLRAQELYGWTALEAIGHTVQDLLKCETEEPRFKALDTLQSVGSWRGRTRRRAKDGSELEIALTWRLGRAPDDKSHGLYETSRDLSGQLRLEKCLRRSEDFAATLFEVGTSALWHLDVSRALALAKAFDGAGDRDLRSHLVQNPALVAEMMKITAVVDVNERALAWLGASGAEALRAQLSRLWPTDTAQFFIDCIVGLLQGGDNATAEIFVRTWDGRTLPALYTSHFSSRSLVDGRLVVAVTEGAAPRASPGKAVDGARFSPALAVPYWELDMRKMNARLSDLRVDGVDDLVAYAVANPEFTEEALALIRISDVNERTLEIMGAARRSDLVGLPVAQFWPDGSRKDFLEALNAGFKGLDWSDRETRLRTLDAREVDVLFSAASSPAMREDGIAVLSVTDITERRQSERRLAESEYRSRKLFEAMALGIWELDFREMKAFIQALSIQGDLFEYWRDHPDFVATLLSKVRVIEVNQKCLELFGAGSQEQLRVDLGTFWPSESHDLFLQAVHHISVLKGDRFEAETRVRRLDGTVFDALFTSWEMPEITDPNHVLVGIVDISEKMAARAEVSRVREEMTHATRVATLGELSASIAHELNQPLAAITALGEANRRWLNRQAVDVSKVRDLNDRIIADAQRASEILARIRNMAVPATATTSAVDVAGVVRDAVKFLEHEFLARDVAFGTWLSPALPPVLADPIQLQQVFVNLVVNAMQAMTADRSSQKRIDIVAATEDGNGVSIFVSDTGPGIPDDAESRIFESFFTTKAAGMGMGLKICRTIIESFGGRIGLVKGGQGATFEIHLPAWTG